MPSFAVLLAGLGATIALAACGYEDTGRASTGVLVVNELPPAQPIHTEGSIAYLRLERPDGAVVAKDRAVTDGFEPRGGRLLRRRLPPGRYRVISYQRPCQGNCSQPEHPTDRCETVVRIRAMRTVKTTVTLGERGGCRLRRA